MVQSEEEIDPPPPYVKSEFESVSAWLESICISETINSSGLDYKFGIFESSGKYTLFLVGMKEVLGEGDNVSIEIAHEPIHMYFPLPDDQYATLKRQQVYDRITRLLEEFFVSKSFGNCFLKDAHTITAEWKGLIWSSDASLIR
jgi:hypothetical protein